MIVRQVLYVRVFEGIDKKSLVLRTYDGKKLDNQLIRANSKEILLEIEKILNKNVNEKGEQHQ